MKTRIYLIDNWLTRGIREMVVEVKEDTAYVDGAPYYRNAYRLSEKEAIAVVERDRKERIAACQKQIDELQSADLTVKRQREENQ